MLSRAIRKYPWEGRKLKVCKVVWAVRVNKVRSRITIFREATSALAGPIYRDRIGI